MNLAAAMRECWRKSDFGRSNGRPRACLRRARRDFMCIHRAFRPIRPPRNGCGVCSYAAPENYSLRRYDDEQWDVMFFLQGRVEMILCDVRAGFSKRIMRFFIDGDNHRSSNNVGVVVPPGVAHAHSRRRRRRCHHGLRDKHDFPTRIRGTHRERRRERGVAGILAEVFG